MIKKKYIRFSIIFLLCTIILTGSNICNDKVTAEPAQVQTNVSVEENTVKPLNVVNSPKTYLNKKIIMNAKFDKFSTLGLDYKPALRSSENYISFLIKRDDTTYDIPLSEMKLFLKRELAEKNINLKTNDEIKITGTVFSDSLGDAWIDVENIIVTKKIDDKDETDKKDGADKK